MYSLLFGCSSYICHSVNIYIARTAYQRFYAHGNKSGGIPILFQVPKTLLRCAYNHFGEIKISAIMCFYNTAIVMRNFSRNCIPNLSVFLFHQRNAESSPDTIITIYRKTREKPPGFTGLASFIGLALRPLLMNLNYLF